MMPDHTQNCEGPWDRPLLSGREDTGQSNWFQLWGGGTHGAQEVSQQSTAEARILLEITDFPTSHHPQNCTLD